MNYEKYFSTHAKNMKKSAIRELLKLTSKPDVISFAGGLPAPDLFPVEEIRQVTDEVMRTEGEKALQYGPTEGNPGLRDELLKLMKKEGIELDLDQLFVITSSQQGLDLTAKIFVDPGDVIMTGKPTYVGAIQAFNSYGADMHPVDLDEDGMNAELLDTEIERLRGLGKNVKFIYTVPDFQNPSGITMSVKRRKEIIAVAEKYDLLIIEDSPYRQLRFEGEPQTPLIALNSERVLAFYTFSKILLPGFRVGWMAGPKDLIQKAIVAKQSVDLCAPPFNQVILREFIKKGLLEKQIDMIIDAYREKRDFMIKLFHEHMPKLDGLKWTEPEGGLFLWFTLPEYMDTTEMFKEAAEEKKVAYVMGSAFDPEGKERNTMRINFSYASKEQIEEGVKRLSKLIASKAK